jgi:hypothetical protein
MKTRESYLIRATNDFRKKFEAHGYELPPVLVSVGFPSKRATAQQNKCIGECWHGEGQKDGTAHIFISPSLDATGPMGALSTLWHECAHAALPAGAGHGAQFKQFMRATGLKGKATSTHAGEELTAYFQRLDEKFKGYPHNTINTNASARRKQTTRLLKVECQGCEYIARVTRKPLEQFGPPICPGCNEVMTEA